MVSVGDRILLSGSKGADREGVVVAVTGSMVRVRWPSDEETTVVPAPGTVTVLGSSQSPRKAAATASTKARATTATTKKSATAKKGKKATAVVKTISAKKEAATTERTAAKKTGPEKRS